MKVFRRVVQLTLCSAAALAALPAAAQDSDHVNDQIRQLQKQIEQQQRQINRQQEQLRGLVKRAEAKPAAPAAAASAPGSGKVLAIPALQGPTLTMSKNNRPRFSSADGQNYIELTSIFNFDVGGYNYRPASSATRVQDLHNGVNARRARIGVAGQFLGDWKYDFQYDLANFDDGLTGTGSIKSGIRSAFISYTGLGAAKFDLGYLNVPFTLDQATANVDYMFMEHSIPHLLAIALTGGDSRSAIGARANDDRYWIGGYLTGPKAGASHTTNEQTGGTLRATYQLIKSDEGSFHIGANLAHLFSATGPQNWTVQPELAIDPTAAYGMTIGTPLNPLRHADVYGVETAGGWRSLFFQGEYFWYSFDREGLQTANFQGGYIQGSWTLTGEHRKYNPLLGADGRIYPDRPFSLATGGTGAFEVTGRVSFMDMNSNFLAGQVNTPSAVNGGKATTYTAGLNWYPNNNLMFRVNYLHGGWMDEFSNIMGPPQLQQNAGASFDAVAARAQLTF